jgi:hypothetical protein
MCVFEQIHCSLENELLLGTIVKQEKCIAVSETAKNCPGTDRMPIQPVTWHSCPGSGVTRFGRDSGPQHHSSFRIRIFQKITIMWRSSAWMKIGRGIRNMTQFWLVSSVLVRQNCLEGFPKAGCLDHASTTFESIPQAEKHGSASEPRRYQSFVPRTQESRLCLRKPNRCSQRQL